MTTFNPHVLLESMNHQDFEALCLELMSARMNPLVPSDLLGVSGQEQGGLDFTLQMLAGVDGYQCKRRKKLPFKAIEEDIEKLDKSGHEVDRLIFLTSARRDIRTQRRVDKCSQKRVSQGRCPVAIIYGARLGEWLMGHEKLLRKYLGHLLPDCEAIRLGQDRRLEREYPGTTLTRLVLPGAKHITLNPGPGGVPFSMNLNTSEARARFWQSIDTGEPVSFQGGEFQLRFSGVLADIFPSGKEGSEVLTIQPVGNGFSVDVRLLVEVKASGRPLEKFVRRGKRSLHGYPAQLTIHRDGRTYSHFSVRSTQLPGVEVHVRKTGEQVETNIVFSQSYAGLTPEQAIPAEQVLSQLLRGGYVGIFGPNDFYLAGEVVLDAAVPSALEGLEVLAQLGEVADWDISLPERLTGQDIEEARGLLELFTTGRRCVRQGGVATVNLKGAESYARVKALAENGQPPFLANITQNAGVVVYLGQSFQMPDTLIRVPEFAWGPKTLACLEAGPADHVVVEMVVPEGVDVVEEWPSRLAASAS